MSNQRQTCFTVSTISDQNEPPRTTEKTTSCWLKKEEQKGGEGKKATINSGIQSKNIK